MSSPGACAAILIGTTLYGTQAIAARLFPNQGRCIRWSAAVVIGIWAAIVVFETLSVLHLFRTSAALIAALAGTLLANRTTGVEVLAVVELAAQDLSVMVNQYLPAGHLLTIDHWRSAPKVRDWYNWGSMAYWAVSALFNPIQTVTRYAASHLGVSQPLRLLQDNLVAWFYVAYVHRVGTYNINCLAS